MMPLRRRALGTSVAFVACLNVSLHAGAAPRPVYLPPNAGDFADPSVASHNNQFYGMATGRLVVSAQGNIASGPWGDEGPALTSRPEWATRDGMWAPDLERISANQWVLYFSALVDGLGEDQRCIGAATASSPLGPFTPVAGGPLVCPGSATGPVAPQPGVTGSLRLPSPVNTRRVMQSGARP